VDENQVSSTFPFQQGSFSTASLLFTPSLAQPPALHPAEIATIRNAIAILQTVARSSTTPQVSLHHSSVNSIQSHSINASPSSHDTRYHLISVLSICSHELRLSIAQIQFPTLSGRERGRNSESRYDTGKTRDSKP
jgi:hypothetical protein